MKNTSVQFIGHRASKVTASPYNSVVQIRKRDFPFYENVSPPWFG